MKFSTFIRPLFALALFAGGVAQANDKLKLIQASELADAIKTDAKAVHVYDANTAEVRAKYGVIPGAALLDSSEKYDLAKLPADKTASLVFYCANTKCMASHKAAERAVKAGYSRVSVMSDGIMGWKDSGQATSKIN